MNILITGGAGYIGYSLINALAKQSTEIENIVIYDNLSKSNYAIFSGKQCNALNTRFIRADILDNRSLDNALRDIDTVVHLAARVDTPNTDADAHSFDQINNWGSAQLATAIEQVSSVSRVVFLSSTAIYGEVEAPADESTAPRPSSVYGTSKLRAESHFERLANKIPVCIIRSGNVYGYNPAVRYNSVINKMVFDAQFQSRIHIEGSGEQTRAFIHVDKIAAAIVGLITHDRSRSGVYNFAEHNFAITDIVDNLVSEFPDLEYLNVDQDMRMRSFSVQLPHQLQDLLPQGSPDFGTEINDFVQQLAI